MPSEMLQMTHQAENMRCAVLETARRKILTFVTVYLKIIQLQYFAQQILQFFFMQYKT